MISGAFKGIGLLPRPLGFQLLLQRNIPLELEEIPHQSGILR